jgi:hypothetical protein
LQIVELSQRRPQAFTLEDSKEAIILCLLSTLERNRMNQPIDGVSLRFEFMV